MESTPLVSVVTPFFNTGEFLAECIESVLQQTYQHWEYILVDNQSTDGSGEIAQRYASRFPGKIHVIRTDSFLSQVQNYNFALTLISPSSKYCKVVQADDWIFPDCVTSMVEVAEAHPSVGIVSAYQIEGDDVHLDGLPYPTPEISGPEVCRLYFQRKMYFFGTPTSLLLRSELIRSRNPFYDEKFAPFEDGHVCFDLLKSWNFGFAYQILTYTRRDNDSIFTRISPFQLGFFLHLSMLIAHGRDYLCEEEYNRRLKSAEADYFLFLCRCALQGRNREFWEFHRNMLASVNYSLGWPLLRDFMPSAVLLEAAGGYRHDSDEGFLPIKPFARMKLAVKILRHLRKIKWQLDRQIGSSFKY